MVNYTSLREEQDSMMPVWKDVILSDLFILEA